MNPRKRFSFAGLTFVLTAAAEIAAFIVVGNTIGYGWAILAIIALSAFGVWLLRREGTRTWRHFRDISAVGGRPGPQMIRGLVGLLGAVLIAIPGFVTGVLGLLLLIPPVRAVASLSAAGLATRRMESNVAGDLFGPRRVRVHVGPTVREPVPTPGGRPGQAGRSTPDDTTPIEGEIV